MEAGVAHVSVVFVGGHAGDPSGEGGGCEKDDGVAGDAYVDRLSEADCGQEIESCNQSPGDRAEGVHGVENADARADLGVF